MANYDKLPNHSVENKIKYSDGSWEEFVINHGASIIWEKSYLCPCVAKNGVPQIDCPICGGLGYAFLPGKETQANLQATSRNVRQSLVGMNTTGTTVATTLEEDFIGIRDRITFSDQDIPVSIAVTVTDSTVQHGKSLRYIVKSVDYAVMLNDEGTPVEYKQGDLNIDFDKNIFYPTEDMIGKSISLNLTVAYRMYVIDILKEARYQYTNDARLGADNRDMVKLPRKLLLRREDQFIPAILNESNDGKFVDTSVNDETGTDVTKHDDIWGAYANV